MAVDLPTVEQILQNTITDGENASKLWQDPPALVTLRNGDIVENLRKRLEDIGYKVPVAFESGLDALDGSFTVTYLGVTYAAEPEEVPFTTTSVFDASQWKVIPELNIVNIGIQSEDVTYLQPTDYSGFQAFLDDKSHVRHKEGARTVYNIEASESFGASETLINGEFSGVSITSDDSTVSVDAGFNADDYLIRMDNATGLVWDVLVDMDDLGRGGIYQPRGTDTFILTNTSGVINAGDNGTNDAGEDDDPYGFGAFCAGRMHILWDDDSTQGADFSGSDYRGLWVTYGGILTGKHVVAQNTGTDPAYDAAHAAAFVSRGGIFHVDNFDASGSQMGIRVARAFASFRDSDLTNIARHAVLAFEGGTATGSRCNISGSGETGHGILVSGTPNSNRPQGGGRIVMEDLDANGTVGDIATCYASDGSINIDNISGANIEGSLAVCSMGLITIFKGDVSVAATSTASQILQSSNGGEIEALGLAIAGNNNVDHIARVADGGSIYLRNATLSGASDTIFDFGEGMGTIFVQNLTIDGTPNLFQGGVTLGPMAHFTKLSDAEFAVQNGFVLPDGNVFFVNSQAFEFSQGETSLSNLPGVKAIDATLEGFGAVGDGITDDLSAIQDAVDWMTTTGGKLAAKAGNTYLMSGTATASGPVNFDATGATFVSSTGARLFGFDAPNTDGPYALTADYVEGATSLAVADTGTALAAGTMIKIHSDAVDAANRDEGSDTSQYRTSEWAVVSEGSTTTNVILERPLRFVEGISPTSTAGDEARVASYTTAMNAKIIVQDMETPFSFVGGTYKAASGAGTISNLIRVQGYHMSWFANFIVRDSTDSGLAIPGTTFAHIHNVGAFNCEQYGLALNGHAPKVTNFTSSKCRHAYTQIAGRATANTNTISTLLVTGSICGGIVNGFSFNGYFEEHAADLHQGAEGWTITNGYIEGAAKAIQNRGRNNKWSNITIRNCGQGVLNLTEYDGGDTDDDFYTAGKTQADFSSATFTDMDIECTAIPFENRSATMTLGGTIRIRSADHTSVYNNGGHVTNTGHIDHVVTEPGGDVGRSVIRVVDPVAAVAGVFPDDASLFVNDGQIVVDATAGTVGLDAFKIDSGSKFINRGFVSVDTPSSGSSFLNGGIMPEIAAGKIIYREAGVVTEVYKQDPVTPEDFEAVGDNSTDDATPLTRWANFVDDIGEGEVGPKTYATSVELVFTSDNVSIRGRGDAAIRQTTWGYSGLQFNGDGCRVEGLKVYTTETRSALSTTFANRYEGYLARVRSSAFLVRGDGFTSVDCKSSGFVSDVRGLGQNVYRTGQNLASRTTTTTLVLDAADTQADDYWIGAVLDLQNISGTGGDTATRVVTDYDNATNTVTFDPAYSGAPTGSDAAYRLTLAPQKDMQITRLKNDGDVDFGIIAQWIDGLQATDCRWATITQTQGDTPHALYLPGSPTNERSRNVAVAGFQVDSSETGLALKFRGVDGVAVSGGKVTSGRGICTFEQCTAATIEDSSILELGANYAGSCWAVDLSGGTDIAVENVTATLASTYTGSDANTVEVSDNAEDGPQQLLTDFRLTDVTLRSDIGTSNNGSLTVQAVRVEQSGSLSPATQRGTIERAKAIETSGDAMTVRAVFAEGHASDLKIIDPYAEGTAGTINPTRVNATCANVFVKWDDIKNSGTNNITGTNNRAEVYA